MKKRIATSVIVPAIIGGYVIQDMTKYSYVAKLEMIDSSGFTSNCGSSRVYSSDQEACYLTAAHCVTDSQFVDIKLNKVSYDGRPIILNSYNFPTDDVAMVCGYKFTGSGKTVEIASDEDFTNLKSDFSKNRKIEAIIIGWGVTSVEPVLDDLGEIVTYVFGDISSDAKKISVNISEITRNEIKVFDPTKTGGGCVGDSGGPLLIKTNGVWKIYGVTSYVDRNLDGSSCSTPGFTTTYASLSQYREWIQNVKSYCVGTGKCIRSSSN